MSKMWQIHEIDNLKIDDVKLILKYPYKPIMDLLLEMVILSEIEKQILENIYFKGYTEEQTAEILNFSKNMIQKNKKKALEKLVKAWSKSELALQVLTEQRA